MNYVFFTLRDFNKVGGGSIRIYGVVNTLAEKGEKVVLISKASDYSQFHPNIEHIKINNNFKSKALLQAMLAFFPSWFVIKIFNNLFKSLKDTFSDIALENSKIFFFEYLDNSIGYLLKQNKIITNYSNDIHGIATIEFKYQQKNEKNIIKKGIAYIKYSLAVLHDKKVFENANGIIFSSNAMKDFFDEKYNIKKSKHYILPNLISLDSIANKVETNKAETLKSELGIKANEFVFFFAGGLKHTSGVDDLLLVFSKLLNKHPNLRLIVIGDGPLNNKVNQLIKDLSISAKTIKLKSVPYKELKSFQSIANVIVCPDKYNEFSNLILHLKYLDALVSDKIVVNGSFDSVKEINKNEFLSLGFEPSNTNDLYKTLEYCVLNEEYLKEKYKNTVNYAYKNLTYDNNIKILLND